MRPTRPSYTDTTRSRTPGRTHDDGRRSVAIVGGGIAGLTAARALSGAFAVEVLDKGRGPGGRASTRREGARLFDHGAQYFTVRDDRLRREVDTWLEEGVAAEWRGRIAEVGNGEVSFKERSSRRFVGVPGMSAIVGRLAQGVGVRFGVRVDRLECDGRRWSLLDRAGDELSSAGILVLALPPEQALSFLEQAGSPLADTVKAVHSVPCWAVLAAFARRLPVEFDGAFVEGPLAWAARDSSKPGRARGERWVLHASPEWSSAHLEDAEEQVARELLREFFEATRSPPETPDFLAGHRWRFAKVEQSLENGFLWDGGRNLGVCGDWCHGCRVEGAFLSGLALAERIEAADGQRKGGGP